MTAESYRAGDHYVICDVCGFKYHSTETRMRWDGLRVCLKDYESRHPQDFVRGRRDRQAVRNARPEMRDQFITPTFYVGPDGIPVSALLQETSTAAVLDVIDLEDGSGIILTEVR